ncbi:RNA 2'-phosphotransferase [Frankia sp. CNm7]|uniref:Probable RNA 2'-phosphotransferase n=1 Tax=Frankia nepalensis TaxID=1836974 RepID=A0A937RF58_9ACTN|nr:RNA 2'-phosphotransferase [Frankia nepalensis]MBL7497963.1 RNA 2'-phosphotransferase [Frankia nepalensis]MBL7509044.1 RNA 2'-phosphotransferase [Frankia nepalensis]MBL7516853.1 RNA 2'-phosphotransferase [Frankia nepalensis]MBL7627850.1 RNA 2'-phosphotransferase [Frankia nepalensis]
MPAEDDNSSTVSSVDLSRAVSHALRHEPWLYELELDDEGWTPVDQLIAALREKGGRWTSVDRVSLERMLETATKPRHERDGERIRALYGHSLTGRIRRVPTTPPATLFHGTAPESWTTIRTDGLLPMGRQYVHLSADRETATSVGLRKSPNPIILLVDAATAAETGLPFYQGNHLVWLADTVPARYLHAPDQRL